MKQLFLDALNYDPETGVFTWKASRFHTKIGKQAGRVNKFSGYRYLNVKGVERLEHRVAWLIMTGEWPEHEVDHKNRDRGDNRWANLRAAKRADQLANSSRPNKSGLRGAYQRGSRFVSQIVRNGKLTYLGTFNTAEEAHAAYVAAAPLIHGEFATDGK